MHKIGRIGVLLLLLVIFISAAAEDRVFKAWHAEQTMVVKTLEWINQEALLKVPIGSKILFDYQLPLTFMVPFKSGLLGDLRRRFYLDFSPHLRVLIRQVETRRDRFRLFLLRSTGEMKQISFKNEDGTIPPNAENLSSVVDMMRKRGISYFVCHYDNWREMIRRASSAGFVFVHGNSRFILFRLRDG